jgi:ectoine hydroxylase-related dioxygenase (phytanoyl-CoA dioxygenase family)
MAVLTEEQRYFFEAQGYLVVPDALDREELRAVRAAADRAEAEWREDTDKPGVRRHDLHQVQSPMEYAPILYRMLEHPRVFPVVRELLGEDIMMLDNDYFLSPPHSKIHLGWHYDENFPGIYHPRSCLMIKVFYVLDDIPENGGGTVILPGSHRWPYKPINTEVPEDMPASVRMNLPAGSAYLMAGRTYHSVGNNLSEKFRRLLIYTYGHKWMKVWNTYEPSEALAAQAKTPLSRQLLGLTDPYGPNAPLEIAPSLLEASQQPAVAASGP